MIPVPRAGEDHSSVGHGIASAVCHMSDGLSHPQQSSSLLCLCSGADWWYVSKHLLSSAWERALWLQLRCSTGQQNTAGQKLRKDQEPAPPLLLPLDTVSELHQSPPSETGLWPKSHPFMKDMIFNSKQQNKAPTKCWAQYESNKISFISHLMFNPEKKFDLQQD